MYIALEQAKRHLNIDLGYTDDDPYIYDLIMVAESQFSKDICEDLKNLEVETGVLAFSAMQAILLLIGNYYNNREPVAFANSIEVPLSYKHLVGLFRNYEQ